MSEVINISNLLAPQQVARDAVRVPAAEDGHRSISEDTVEISEMGFALMRAANESSLRLAKTRAIREEISAGVYETPERIDGTVTRLLDLLG